MSFIKTTSDKEIFIRKAMTEDVQKLFSFLEKNALEDENASLYPLGQLPSLEEIKELCTPYTHQLSFLALDANEVIGFLKFTIPFPKNLWLKHRANFEIAVLKEYRQEGIGTGLLKNMEEHAKISQVLKLETNVGINQLSAMVFFKQNGYVVEGIRTKALCINEQFFDVFFLSKFLNP